jgi:hypothetical protein
MASMYSASVMSNIETRAHDSAFAPSYKLARCWRDLLVTLISAMILITQIVFNSTSYWEVRWFKDQTAATRMTTAVR